MTGLLLAWLAGAAPASETPSLLHGDDLTAYEALPDETAPRAEQVAALQAFLLDHRASPLAERAWLRLVALEGDEAAFRRRHPGLVAALERSAAAHAREAARTPVAVAVAPLTPEGEPRASRSPWSLYLHAGAALDDTGGAGAVGVRLGRGAWSGVVRVQGGSRAQAEVGARLSPVVFGAAWLGVAADSRLRGIARAGVTAPLGGRWSLDTSLGVAVGRDGPAPVVRLELALGGRLARTPAPTP